ncbi:uncharacterized protein EI97DRAFT_377350 [Westerdykella ornata]|uniref:BTB domain-containing protein n=1 Tax=Westerdykella ornata TaxID=318751 RepID=A0A6A6JJ59_WESOR|nr:uncharacterized protein EI97DRAFT_377350 [Westerdykella ornata]KAF2276507.1 hypothetical protein EI97DRAFT_377350 [Westerdykella ornata]
MNQPEDVEVILTYDRRYVFHSSVLARCSTFLASLLTERTAATLSSKARNAGIKLRWMLELTQAPDEDHPAGQLELVVVTHVSGLVINENGRIPTSLFDNYEKVFFAFYNREILISDDDMPSALRQAIELIDIAEYLGSIPVISKPIDVALIKHGQDLWRSIQKMPWGWVHLAMRIKSDLIFIESVIHLAGNWRKISADRNAMENLSENCPESVRLLCQRLHRQLISHGKRLEVALVTLYPGGMNRPSEQVPIKREHYSREILVWMALCFFRHWLGQRLVLGHGSLAPDSGYELYSMLGASGEAYMDKEVMHQFHIEFPMTQKAMNVLENHLLEIKDVVRKTVVAHGILESKCMLDTRRYPVDYLTSVEVRKEDIPWYEKRVQEETIAGLRKEMRPRRKEVGKRNQTAASMQERIYEPDSEEDEDGFDEGFLIEEERAKRARLE